MNKGTGKTSEIAIVLPCLNDFASISRLILEIDKILKKAVIKHKIYICDDGSTKDQIKDLTNFTNKHANVELLIGEYKSGHQEAILRGLNFVSDTSVGTRPDVVVMDSDGEDNPEHIIHLVEELNQTKCNAVLAKRGTRHSGIRFVLLHKLFNIPFKLLTGKKLETGNFMIINGDWLLALVKLPSVSNHVSASVTRFAPTIKLLTLDRSKRYFGNSQMNTASLSLHGYGALAVYADIALSRLVIMTTLFGGFIATVGLTLVVLKLLITDLFLPGWTSNAVLQIFSLILITIFQAVTTTIIILSTKKK